jgi:hypothetical protein
LLGDYSPILFLDLGLDTFDGLKGLNLESDGAATEGLYENHHDLRGGLAAVLEVGSEQLSLTRVCAAISSAGTLDQ